MGRLRGLRVSQPTGWTSYQKPLGTQSEWIKTNKTTKQKKRLEAKRVLSSKGKRGSDFQPVPALITVKIKLINRVGGRPVERRIPLPAQPILWCCCFCALHRPVIWISHGAGAPARPLAAPLLPWLKQVSRRVVFVNDSLHLNSCHSPVKGGKGRRGKCLFPALRNVSRLHMLNLALQMSRQTFAGVYLWRLFTDPGKWEKCKLLKKKEKGGEVWGGANPVGGVDLYVFVYLNIIHSLEGFLAQRSEWNTSENTRGGRDWNEDHIWIFHQWERHIGSHLTRSSNLPWSQRRSVLLLFRGGIIQVVRRNRVCRFRRLEQKTFISPQFLLLHNILNIFTFFRYFSKYFGKKLDF